jgi:hypothetical protein
MWNEYKIKDIDLRSESIDLQYNFKIVQKIKVSEVVCEHRGRLLNVYTVCTVYVLVHVFILDIR